MDAFPCSRGLWLTPGLTPGQHFTPAGGSLVAGLPHSGDFPFMLQLLCSRLASSERDAGAGGSGGRASATHWSLRRGRRAGSSIGGCVSDFALAPLRGLDVQTSPERAEREGPARGRRRQEAPPLKGAGRAPPLGRTRGRKEGARLPAGPGCERPQGGQPRAGARAGLRLRQGGSGRWPPEAGRAGPGSQRRSGGRSRRPTRAAAGESESQQAASRTLRPGGGGGRAREGWGLSAPRACGPRTPPELCGASLKAAPAPLFSPFFLLHCRSGKNVGAGRG